MDAKHFMGEPRVLIDRDALLHNAALLRRTVHSDVKICAILKADAYGHDAGIVADTLCNFSTDEVEAPAVDAIAVASIDEAADLPAVTVPVVVFRPVENSFIGRLRHKLELAIRNDWVLTLCSAAAADDVARIAQSCGKRAQVQIMIDTGMTRSGVQVEHLPALLDAVTSRGASLKLASVCTHFASADDPASDFTAEQARRFDDCTQGLGERFNIRLIRHAANSGALFFSPKTHYDMVRPGLALYGIDPLGRPCLDRKLKPAMKWTAPLISIKEVAQGCGVGYGQTWRAPRNVRIGLVPVGYADGYLRCFSNRAMMMVHGKAAPVVGRVSMDMTTIDLSNIPATVGDEVTLLDNDPLSPASVYELARCADTIPYEILCRIGPRVHRVAVGPRMLYSSNESEENGSWLTPDSTSAERSA